MRIIGVNNGHDPSCALLCDGNLVVFSEEERLNRFRHGVHIQDMNSHLGTPRSFFPFHSLSYCLEAARLSIDDLDLVVVANNDEWIADRIPIKDKRKVTFLPEGSHHFAHALAAFFSSPFDSAAVLVVDYNGSVFERTSSSRSDSSSRLRTPSNQEVVERYYAFRPHDGARAPGPKTYMYEAESGWQFTSRALDDAQLAFRNVYPLDDIGWKGLGAMYATTCEVLGLVSRQSGMDESGKLMALAAYGTTDAAMYWRLHASRDFLLDFEGLRNFLVLTGASSALGGLSPVEPPEDLASARLARNIQDNLEAGMLHLARSLRQATNQSRLCLSGGVALNVIANRRILDESGFDEVFVLPPCNDAGNALGAAFWGHLREAGSITPEPVRSFYLGRSHSQPDVDAVPATLRLRRLHADEVIQTAAGLLAAGQTLGWYQDGSEAGPRALGNRSILADPRSSTMRDHINHCVKLRETYRPFAPAVLEPYAADWFDLDCSPYMLMAARVRERARALVPAIMHVDGTARVQIVSRHQNLRLYDLIDCFREQTGIPLVLNTSFNGPGEPLVETPADALRCFDALDLDALFLQDHYVEHLDPTAALLMAAPGWRDSIQDVLCAPRNQRFISHVCSTAGIPVAAFDDLASTCLGELCPGTLASACVGMVEQLEDPRYLLRRLYFFLRREKLAMDAEADPCMTGKGGERIDESN